MENNDMADIEHITKTTTVQLLKGPKCAHEWEPRTEKPKQCPGCQVRLGKYWNKEVKA